MILGIIVSGGTSVADASKSTVTVASPIMDKPSSSTSTTATTPKMPTATSVLNNPQPIVKLVKLSTSPSTVITSCDITNNQEQIVEKAKQVIAIYDCFSITFFL